MRIFCLRGAHSKWVKKVDNLWREKAWKPSKIINLVLKTIIMCWLEESVSTFIEWKMTGWPGHRLWKTWKGIKESHKWCHRERETGTGIRKKNRKKRKKDTASLLLKTGWDWLAQKNKVKDEDDLKNRKLLAVKLKVEWCPLGSVIICSMWWKDSWLDLDKQEKTWWRQ